MTARSLVIRRLRPTAQFLRVYVSPWFLIGATSSMLSTIVGYSAFSWSSEAAVFCAVPSWGVAAPVRIPALMLGWMSEDSLQLLPLRALAGEGLHVSDVLVTSASILVGATTLGLVGLALERLSPGFRWIPLTLLLCAVGIEWLLFLYQENLGDAALPYQNWVYDHVVYPVLLTVGWTVGWMVALLDISTGDYYRKEEHWPSFVTSSQVGLLLMMLVYTPALALAISLGKAVLRRHADRQGR